MRLIESKDNPLYKRMLRLAHDRRETDGQHQLVWLEGIHLCQMWLEHRGLPELAVFELERDSEELLELSRFLPERLCVSLSPRLMSAVSQVGQGQGVAFVVRVPRARDWAAPRGTALLLDHIQDPGNVGTLLRTAVAVGVSEIYLSKGSASVWSQKVLRSAQGAHFSLDLYEQVDGPALLEQCRIPVLATALDEQAVDLYQLALPPACLWVFGNEGQGVDARLLAGAAHRVYIPQARGVESLNVAVAGALCLYEQRRQHR